MGVVVVVVAVVSVFICPSLESSVKRHCYYKLAFQCQCYGSVISNANYCICVYCVSTYPAYKDL